MTMLRNRYPATAPSKPLILRWATHSRVSRCVDRENHFPLAGSWLTEALRVTPIYHVLRIRRVFDIQRDITNSTAFYPLPEVGSIAVAQVFGSFLGKRALTRELCLYCRAGVPFRSARVRASPRASLSLTAPLPIITRIRGCGDAGEQGGTSRLNSSSNPQLTKNNNLCTCTV